MSPPGDIIDVAAACWLSWAREHIPVGWELGAKRSEWRNDALIINAATWKPGKIVVTERAITAAELTDSSPEFKEPFERSTAGMLADIAYIESPDGPYGAPP